MYGDVEVYDAIILAARAISVFTYPRGRLAFGSAVLLLSATTASFIFFFLYTPKFPQSLPSWVVALLP
jgi:hypothetical protein